MAGPWEAYAQPAAAVSQGPWSAFARQAEPQVETPAPDAEPADHGLSERQKLSPVQKAISPITSYPETYSRMNREAQALTSAGYNQAKNADNIKDAALGAGKAALGALGYVSSPISAAYRSVVGQPVEDVTGIPREYTEFAAQLATPGIGLTGAAKAPPVKGVATTITETGAPVITDLKAAAKSGYKDPAFKDFAVTTTPIRQFADETALKLSQDGLDAVNAPKTHQLLSNWIKVPENAVVTGQNIQTLRRSLGNVSGEASDKAAAAKAIQDLDDLFPRFNKSDVVSGDPVVASQVFKEANANYSAAKQAEKLDDAVFKADLQAAASNSGQNVGNVLRQKLKNIASNPKYRRGFTDDELDQIESIVRGTSGSNSSRMASNVLGGGGGLGALASGAVGSMAVGPAGYLTPFVGQALRSWSNKATLTSVQKLNEAVRSRAPLASSMRKFEERATGFDGTPRAVAGLTIASRNLSNNLRGAGINISPQELLQAIQSPQSSNANEGEIPRRE